MKKEEYAYIGDLSQVLRVEEVRMQGGKKDGVRAAMVTNEAGLSYTVVADRCMDISHLSFQGVNISYINPCGVVAPAYYDNQGTNFLKSFTAGFLTTCGLNNVGGPCEDGESHGLHGRISHTPADEYAVTIDRNEDDNSVRISGRMKESFLFSEKLHLKRTIQSFQKKNRLIITDEIENVGFQEEEYMLLYHFNIGYPFLSPDCELQIDSSQVTPANEYSAAYAEQSSVIDEPSDVGEMCYFHNMNAHDGIYRAEIVNRKLGIGFCMSIENQNLDHFIQWKNLSKGQYVLGLEPATNYIGGKAAERETGSIKKIMPQDKAVHTITIDFYSLD